MATIIGQADGRYLVQFEDGTECIVDPSRNVAYARTLAGNSSRFVWWEEFDGIESEKVLSLAAQAQPYLGPRPVG